MTDVASYLDSSLPDTVLGLLLLPLATFSALVSQN